MNRNTSEGFQYQLDIASGRHDRRMMNAMLRQPRECAFGQSRFKQEVVARNPVADQRAVRVVALLQEELVVKPVVDSLFLVPGMSGQQMNNGLGPRILRGEIRGRAGPEERAQGLEKADACILVSHERRNCGRRRRHVLHALRDQGLQG